MKRAILATAAVVVALPLAAGVAIAAKGHHGGFGLRMMDADRDGKITQAEAKAFGDARFSGADADGDGRITRAEVEAKALERMRAHIDRRFAAADADGDGVISQAEADAQAEKRFARMDKNGDGVIAGEELERRRHRGPHGHREHMPRPE